SPTCTRSRSPSRSTRTFSVRPPTVTNSSTVRLPRSATPRPSRHATALAQPLAPRRHAPARARALDRRRARGAAAALDLGERRGDERQVAVDGVHRQREVARFELAVEPGDVEGAAAKLLVA